MVPQSAAYENQNQNQVGEEKPAAGDCGAVGPKGKESNRGRAAPSVVLSEGRADSKLHALVLSTR